jgi:pyruvate kinase
MFNKTKIIATIGPSSNSRPILKKLISSGMNVARLNFSHGCYKDHEKVINHIRALSKEMDKPVGILLDLQGPKIRTDTLKNGKPVVLKKNKTIQLTSKQVPGDADIVSTTYKNLSKDVKIKDKILIDDGLIELRVLYKTKDTVTCKIISGGKLKERKGINLPGVKVSTPSLTEKDKKDLLFGLKKNVDFFALSFVRNANDLKKIKSIIKVNGSDTPVIAKIEKPEAVGRLDEILKIADGIMVARGDLGVEMRPEMVPKIQKEIIYKSIMANKPVITATQMLETMTDKPIPTRAEASDVANAIYDGTDAIMLSGETAIGKYPAETVKMMRRIAVETENSPFMKYNVRHKKDRHELVTHAVAQSCVNILHEVNAKAIVTFSISGKTSKLISRQRPLNPVFTFSPLRKIYNKLSLVWGVTPLLIPPINNAIGLIEAGEKIIISKKFAKKNDLIIIVTGLALKSGSTNLIKIHTIGKED